MRTSKYKLYTLREDPSNAELISHKLMIKSGMIRQSNSGFYVWLPIGIRILNKLKNFIRKTLDKAGLVELSLPIVQSSSLWKDSGRINLYGSELIKFKDRRGKLFLLSPTNEEFVTNLIFNEIVSIKELPLNIYQIQTKFRDEIRPRFGVIRAREFLMKDAYSFHINESSLKYTYEDMHNIYCRIFNDMKIKFFIKRVEDKFMGSNISHEFQTYTESITIDDKINSRDAFKKTNNTKDNSIKLIHNIKIKNILSLSKFTNIDSNKFTKIIIVKSSIKKDISCIALMLKYDNNIDKDKVEMLPQVYSPLKIFDNQEIISLLGIDPEFLGIFNLSVPLIVDISVSLMSNFVTGANMKNGYFINVNWNRDINLPQVADICKNVTPLSYCNIFNNIHKNIKIEIGHIFKIGNKYSNLMKSKISNIIKDDILMGCYGIGITRLLAAIIENNHRENTILWPSIIAPFDIAIIPIFNKNTLLVKDFSEELYFQLNDYGIDVLLYDNNERPGVMLSNTDLLGIPNQVIISDDMLEIGMVKYKHLSNKDIFKLNKKEIVDFLLKKVVCN